MLSTQYSNKAKCLFSPLIFNTVQEILANAIRLRGRVERERGGHTIEKEELKLF